MQLQLKGIILSNVKLGDTKKIVKIYTRERGLRSYLTRTGNSSKSKIKAANLLPLNQVDINVSEKENRDLGNLIEIRCEFIYLHLHTEIQKMSIASFINEILIKCLRESESNPDLFDYISLSLQKLDSLSDSINDFHLKFMYYLSKHLGFLPINNYVEENKFFDLTNGLFLKNPPNHPDYLNKEESALFAHFLEKMEGNDEFQCTHKAQRKLLLDILITYFKIHIPGMSDMKSLSVLRETFA